ncbi:ATP-binding cassette domain-containing protein [Streptomyces sp. NBC_00385]|uniref:ATP-binding cassette domain-containing protein n=1 Tax=Streptomyces sp. NBC_00385 TaxID=2975733 RepID=UPI002DDC5554|nr:ATP-binding cassette domain-containing protein [Streptomyces sp. NBC_00385]WRZ03228.1 ATP-binding cassette domain-containing protein [Streptomyces sp. NBC_00385]
MLQAIGLTSARHRGLPPAVDDLTFEAGSGSVTALLGPPGSGKTSALRLMLEIAPGRGVTYFRGRPLHRVAHPAREVGVLLGDVPGHPARTVRGQLRMLCAAAGVPATRADDVLDAVGLVGLGDQRIGTLSLGMDRRLALASALLADPHTLILDEPAEGLGAREADWLHGMLRSHADRGGTVLYTTQDPKEAARSAGHVVTIDSGRLVADQEAADFSRTRLRPRVAVRSPHAARLAAIVSREARAARRSVEVVTEASSSRLSVYGSSCAEIGDTAFRHGLPVHQLADEVGDTGPASRPRDNGLPGDGLRDNNFPGDAPPGDALLDNGLPGDGSGAAADARPATGDGAVAAASRRPAGGAAQAAVPAGAQLPPRIRRRPARGPLRPVRYELRRLFGVRTTTLIVAVTLVASAAVSVALARNGRAPLPNVLVAWPSLLPLPPAALGAGLLGALSFGDEFRYPALAAGRGTVPRRLGLLLAKLAVSAGVALSLGLIVVLVSAESLRLVYGGDLLQVPSNVMSLAVSWSGLTVGCAWAGLLAAGIFRVTAAGVAAVLAVPVLMVPLIEAVPKAPTARSVSGLPGRLRELTWLQWPHEADRWVLALVRVVAHPVGTALTLSLSVLVCAYLFTSLRGRVRW